MLSTSQPIVPPIQSDASLWFASVLFHRRAPQLHRVFWQIISGHSEEFESGRRRMLRWFMYNPRSTNQSRSPQPLTWLQRQHKKCLQLPKLNYINFLRHFLLLIAARLVSIRYFKQSDARNQIPKKCCHQLRFRVGRALRWGAMPRKPWAGTLQTLWLLFWLLNAPPCTSRCSSSDFTPLSGSHALDEDNLLILSLVVLEFRLFFFCLSRMWFQKVNSVHRRSWFVEPHCC